MLLFEKNYNIRSSGKAAGVVMDCDVSSVATAPKTNKYFLLLLIINCWKPLTIKTFRKIEPCYFPSLEQYQS